MYYRPFQRENSELELPSAAEGQMKLGEIGDAEVERAIKKMKKAERQVLMKGEWRCW